MQPAQKPLHYSHPLQSRSLSVPATATVQSFLPHSERTSYDGNSTRADSSAVINETTMGQVLCEVSHGPKEYKKPVKNVRMHIVKTINQSLHTIRWRGGATSKAFGLAISRSRVEILLEATLRNNLRQVVYTYVTLSPSSITWYRPKGGDALRLRRYCRPGGK